MVGLYFRRRFGGPICGQVGGGKVIRNGAGGRLKSEQHRVDSSALR